MDAKRKNGNDACECREIFVQTCHDLKPALCSIVFLADALYSGSCGELDAAQRAQIRVIYSAALSTLNRVQNTLDSHELEVGVSQPVRVPLSLRAALQELERVALPLTDMHGLDLRVELACASMREGDPDILNRILLNLLTRALSLTETGGVFVRVGSLDADLLVAVAAGPDLEETDLEGLFSDFGGRTIRAGTSREGDPLGSTLALSICHRLAQSVGGEISVELEPPGFHFGVRLPFPPLQVECDPVALDCSRAARGAAEFRPGF